MSYLCFGNNVLLLIKLWFRIRSNWFYYNLYTVALNNKPVSSCCRQWLPRSKLEPLGVDSGLDKAKQLENKKPNVRRAVRKAYEKAVMHRCKVTGEPNPLSSESEFES